MLCDGRSAIIWPRIPSLGSQIGCSDFGGIAMGKFFKAVIFKEAVRNPFYVRPFPDLGLWDVEHDDRSNVGDCEKINLR